MYCPNCRVEYRSGSERCCDCEVPLVEVLPNVAFTTATGSPTVRRRPPSITILAWFLVVGGACVPLGIYLAREQLYAPPAVLASALATTAVVILSGVLMLRAVYRSRQLLLGYLALTLFVAAFTIRNVPYLLIRTLIVCGVAAILTRRTANDYFGGSLFRRYTT